MKSSADSERLLVLAPYGRDAQLTQQILSSRGFEVAVCRDMDALCRQMREAVGAALVAEEALAHGQHRCLLEVLEDQPPWSDLPLIIFGAAAGAGSNVSRSKLEGVQTLGNASLLDRPVGLRPLLSAVNSALRARRRQYQARRAIEQRDQFLAMLGHELRNPLAAITLAVDAADLAKSDERRGRHLGVVRRQAHHLARLVDDLLDVARVTTGKIMLDREVLDAGDVVSRCAATLSPLAYESGVTLRTSSAGPLLVDADPVRLEQILTNLVMNAIKYTPAGGHIDVDAWADGGHACIQVKDTGVGMEQRMLRDVFELFVQVPGTLDRARGGLGIGLTLVRHLVDLHDGRIEAHSDGPGTGSLFLVRLPLATTTALPMAVSPVVDGAHKSPARRDAIVVVDDSDDVRESLREVLEELGHHVEVAADGEEGLARILEVRPAVALVDIGLPGIDGYEVAKQARAALADDVRLIAISGYGQPRDKEAATAAGFERHFTKPVPLKELLSCLPTRERS